jgi:hypothetical protein
MQRDGQCPAQTQDATGGPGTSDTLGTVICSALQQRGFHAAYDAS